MPFPIIATALLLFLVLEPPLRIIVPYVSGIAFVVFSMIVMIDSIEVSSKQNLGLTSVYGLFAGLFYCANWLGNFAMEAVREQGLLQEATVTIAVVALLYGCSIVMFFVTRAPRELSLIHIYLNAAEGVAAFRHGGRRMRGARRARRRAPNCISGR